MGTLELTQIEALELLAKEAKGKLEYRRIQSVLLREKFGKDVEDIAEMLHLHKRTVYKHCERYEKEGISAFEPKTPGPKKGEGPRLMSQEQESPQTTRLLQPSLRFTRPSRRPTRSSTQLLRKPPRKTTIHCRVCLDYIRP